ncbi:M23 family metallopeptidase [Spirochaeta cellobiosiphila]|uniref:M23 family metallopeptidase n=1 Tax=Spirochaeta cellobiosiphila TaxID=504483 RepID=UPI000406DE7C|nr:M23 family metallopeptidase [Spirochaeta cellobiosiphila]
MSPVNRLKKTEKDISKKASQGLKSRFFGAFNIFKRFRGRGQGKYTVMLIPHTEKKPFNFQISLFALIFTGAFLMVVVGGFLFYSTKITGVAQTLSEKVTDLQSSETNMEVLRKEIGDLKKSAEGFEDSLSQTLSVLGLQSDSNNDDSRVPLGDLSYFLGIDNVEQGSMAEVSDLRSLSAYMEGASKPIEEIGKVLSAQKDLLVDIPTMWPVQNGIGYVTAEFGPAVHPFTGAWYLHKGIDIAYRPGTPLVATANGKVIEAGYDRTGYGNYVLIRHKYGFYTKYAHMNRILVTKGQDVHRGQVIGLLGSTGMATGPHTHYEIHLGTQVVDPRKYMNISTTILNDK